MLYENDGTYVLNNAASGTTHLYAVTLDVVDAYLAQVEREDDLAPKVIHMLQKFRCILRPALKGGRQSAA